jgi:hypothetical protein
MIITHIQQGQSPNDEAGTGYTEEGRHLFTGEMLASSEENALDSADVG